MCEYLSVATKSAAYLIYVWKQGTVIPEISRLPTTAKIENREIFLTA